MQANLTIERDPVMKIFYLYSELTIKGGADKVLIDKANYLAEHGY